MIVMSSDYLYSVYVVDMFWQVRKMLHECLSSAINLHFRWQHQMGFRQPRCCSPHGSFLPTPFLSIGFTIICAGHEWFLDKRQRKRSLSMTGTMERLRAVLQRGYEGKTPLVPPHHTHAISY